MIEDKPITLITGSPGSGKTALIVDFIDKAIEKGRPVFQMGIPELSLPHVPTPPIEEWTEQRPDPDHPELLLPYFTFPQNSLVVLSEAQRVYRPRANGSRVPDHVAAFETVRHTGVTFILDTQHPSFVDSHIKKLVGQHIHLIDFGFLGRKHYEWPYCGEPEQFKTAPIKKPYKLPKRVFSLYKSSSLHIKRNYTLPPAVVALAILATIFVGGGGYLWHSMSKKFQPQTVANVENGALGSREVGSVSPGHVAVAVDDVAMELTPRIYSRPETAPAYDALRQAKSMPVVVGCIATQSRCRCQTQQGTDAGLDDTACRSWLAKPPFNPYHEPEAPAQVAGAARNEPTRPPVADAESMPSAGGGQTNT